MGPAFFWHVDIPLFYTVVEQTILAPLSMRVYFWVLLHAISSAWAQGVEQMGYMRAMQCWQSRVCGSARERTGSWQGRPRRPGHLGHGHEDWDMGVPNVS